MKERILKHWVTSLIGIAVLSFGGAGLWFAKIDATTALLLIGAGIGFLGVKDPFKK